MLENPFFGPKRLRKQREYNTDKGSPKEEVEEKAVLYRIFWELL